MADSIKKIVDNYIHEQSKKKKLVITLMILSLFVVTGVFWSLKLNGIALAGDAFCGQEEHAHSEECYEMELICSLEENEEHVHSDECYEKKLICEKEEHTHIDLCYADINADKENKTVWEATLPSLSDDWSKDLVSVAKSQLGYQESEKNFKMAEDGITRKGYSRYGAWYGNEYGDWNGMFVAFCLNHAGISQEIIPSQASSQELMNSLQSKELFKIDNCQAGDIIFFDNQRMGIVVEVGNQIQVIEGDSDNKVQKVSYALNDTSIKGYANIQKAEEIAQKESISTLQATIYLDNSYQQESDDNTKITVSGHLPKDAVVKAVPMAMNVEGYTTVLSYDLSMFNADGTEYIPEESVEISITSSSIDSNDSLLIYNGSEFLDSIISESTVKIETKQISKFAVLKETVQTFAGNQVTNQADLINAINNNEELIELAADFTVTGKILLINKNITLDLNGHKLTATGTDTLFEVPAGSQLTIKDSQAKVETTENQTGEVYGKVASYTETTLTYFVTESNVTNVATGATNETLVKHTVDLSGRISAGNATAVKVTGGTVNFESGMLYNGTNRAFNMTSGTLNLKGGYVFGFKKNENGAAIYANNNSIINLSGSVLAANESTGKNVNVGCGGAIATIGNTTINITGGVISGNKADGIGSWDGNNQCGGGGIYCGGNATVTMSGGYLTNNYVESTRYFDGGGGLFLTGTSKFTLNSGYITGNQAQGGGGIKTDFNKSPIVIMNGGFISANAATSAEGGGVTIDRNGQGYFNGGYITNNRITNTVHWGGGGLFCADGADLFLKKALITENDAGGFGGGVAGCPTGKIYLYIDEGCAIYNNDDVVDGEIHFVNGGAKDGIDVERCDKFFQSHGHKDYFCALNSTVTGTMLGNNPANWEGSADGTAVNLGANDAQTATSVMGLESHPTEDGISAAQSNAAVYINGNYSYTHGGGILCNGNLIIGKPTDIEVPARLGLNATKVFLDGDGDKVLDLSEYNFQFEVIDSNDQVVSTGTCDDDGKITFENLEFNEAGTYVYTIREKVDDSKPSINYDSTEYRLTVTVIKKSTPLYEATKTAYLITNTKVEKSKGNGIWETVSNINYQGGKDNLALALTPDTDTFINTTVNVSKITVVKKWADNIIGADRVTVDLYQDGIIYDTIELNEGNNWTYTWTNLPVGHSYHVEEREIKGYIASYTTSSSSGNRKSYWVPANSLVAGEKYMIVSGDGGKALYVTENHRNAGFDTTDTRDVIQRTGILTVGSNTYSNWYDSDSIDLRCVFTAQNSSKNGNMGIILKNDGTSAKTWLLVQSSNNNYLKGTSGANYASFMNFSNGVLKGQNDYNWNPNNLRTIIYETGKFNTSSDSTKAAKLYTLVSGSESDGSIITITNTPTEDKDYELPETGGKGTYIFTLIGLLLMVTPFVYKYHSKRKQGKA